MSNQDITSQQQQGGSQLFQTKMHQAKVVKTEEGGQTYEAHLHQAKLSEDQGIQSYETKSLQTKMETKPDQGSQSSQSGVGSSEEPSRLGFSQQSKPSEIQFQERQKPSGPVIQEIKYQQEPIPLPPPTEKKSKISQQPQESQSYSFQSVEKQPPGPELQQSEFQRPPQFIRESKLEQPSQIKQDSHVKQESQIEQQPSNQLQEQQGNQPQIQGQQPTTVVYEVYRAQMQPSQGMQSQNIQTQGTQGAQGTQLPEMQQLFQGIDSQTIPGFSNLSVSNTWIQPLPDAKGTVAGKANFTREDAKRDALCLLRAMKGAGTDKNTIVDISGNRTFAQRQMIADEYANIDPEQRRDLLQDLKSEVGGDLESLVLPLYMMPGELDARLLEKAMYGLRNDVEVLVEVLCTRTNKELQDMKEAWKLKIDPKVRLEEKVGDETKTWFGTTNFHVLCTKLLEANRPPCSKPDEKQVRLDAEDLHHQLLERNDVNNAKAKFVEVFTERSWAHVGAVVGEFQKISDQYTMEAAIRKEFGSSNTTKALQVMAEFCAQPYDFWAKRLRDAMKGLGTSDNQLVRIVISRCEVDMNNIVLVFGQRYGDGKNLKSWIDSETSGPYAQLLSYLCGFH